MNRFPEDPSPSGQQSDTLRQLEKKRLHRSATAQRIFAALEAMNATGDDAEERYEEALRALRAHPAESVVVTARLECEVPRNDYATRWALVYIAGELRHPDALPLLREIVLTPIPPEENADPHSSTVGEETIIRTTAVDAVAELARDGNEEAVQALLDFFEVPSFSIRRAAVQGLLSTPEGDDLRDRMRKCLPKDQHFLLDLKKVDVRRVPQIDDPQRHLSETGKAEDKPAAPDITDRSDADRSIFRRKRRQTDLGSHESEQTDSPPTGEEHRREY